MLLPQHDSFSPVVLTDFLTLCGWEECFGSNFVLGTIFCYARNPLFVLEKIIKRKNEYAEMSEKLGEISIIH